MFNIRIVWDDYNTMVYTVNASSEQEAIKKALDAAPKNRTILHAMVDQGYNVGY